MTAVPYIITTVRYYTPWLEVEQIGMVLTPPVFPPSAVALGHERDLDC
jgi:hypothetical protein